MSDESSATIHAYNTGADRYAAYLGRAPLESELDQFAAMLPPGAWVVDAGAGPGRYSLALETRGVHAVSLGLSGALLRAGAALGVRRCVRADMVRLPFSGGALDGVWACASLLHLLETIMPQALAELRRSVRTEGAAFISVKLGQGAEWVKSPGGRRYFKYYQPDKLDALLTAAGWQIVNGQIAPDERRPDVSWIARFCRAV